MTVGGLWMPEHSTLECVNGFLGHSFAARVPTVCVSAVQRRTVVWESGLRLKQEPNSWVDCYFWIELVRRTELLIKAFGRSVHNWRVLYVVYIHIFIFYHFRKNSLAFSLSLDLFLSFSVHISFEKILFVLIFFHGRIDFSLSRHEDDVLRHKGTIGDKK